MRANRIREIWNAGGVALNGWAGIPSSYSAELLGHQGLDSVTVDMQHGMMGFGTAVTMLQAVSATPAVPFARVPGNDIAIIDRLLDAGAYGIICPMISTPADARRLAEACRYPPRGNRSFGPARGLLYGGSDYFAHANDEIVALAMIETLEGLENLDEILATDGLDGIFVGPNDLCLALGVAPRSESDEPVVKDAIARIVQTCRSKDKVAGVFCSSGAAAAARAAEGFNLVTPSNDATLLAMAANREAGIARGDKPDSAPGESRY